MARSGRPHQVSGRPRAPSVARPPLHVRLFSRLLERLLRGGVALGSNGLITVRGRRSGEPCTAAVAIIPVDGRRWVRAPWGDVHWVHNLRAAGRARITARRQEETVTATELDYAQRLWFFRNVLGPLARNIPFGVTFIRVADGVDLNKPEEAAEGRRVFELHPDNA